MKILLINCSPVRNGATAEIVKVVNSCLKKDNEIRSICIDDYDIKYCKGCRSCHLSAKCIQEDDTEKIIGQYDWADIPGQFKVFIDRCTPWCDTHEPHATIKSGKKGYTIALRAGSSMRECNKIIESIEHFYGHLGIEPSGSLGLCSVEYKEAVADRTNEIEEFCNRM